MKSTHPREEFAKERPDEMENAPEGARERGTFKKKYSRMKHRKGKRHSRRK